MRISVIVLVVASLGLASCGGWRDSRLNPGNWFGGSRSVPVATSEGTANTLIPGRSIFARKPDADRSVPIDTVTELRVERSLTGAIIQATGVAVRQGAYQAELRPANADELPENGVLSYTFRVVYPNKPRPVGTERTRTVEVARSLSRQQLAGVKTIRVTAARNARETRRR